MGARERESQNPRTKRFHSHCCLSRSGKPSAAAHPMLRLRRPDGIPAPYSVRTFLAGQKPKIVRSSDREREREKEDFSRVLFSGRVGNAGGVGFRRCRQPETERRRPVPVAIRPLCCWCCAPRLFLTFLPK